MITARAFLLQLFRCLFTMAVMPGIIYQKAKTQTKLKYLFQLGWERKVFNLFDKRTKMPFLYPGKMSLHANLLHFHFDRNKTNIIKKEYAKFYSYGRLATCTISNNYKHFSNPSISQTNYLII